MKLRALLPLLIFAGVMNQVRAADDSPCMRAYQAEVDRISREAEQAARVNPPGRDLYAQQQFMIPIHDALKAAAERADICEKGLPGRSSNAAVVTANIRAEQCMDYADRSLVTLRQRNAARPPQTPAERAAAREAENRIGDERAACLRQAR
jgi:hypothetical protein